MKEKAKEGKTKEAGKPKYTVEDRIYIEKEGGKFECTVFPRTTDDPEVAKHWIPTVCYFYKNGTNKTLYQNKTSGIFEEGIKENVISSMVGYSAYVDKIEVLGDGADVDKVESSLKASSMGGVSV